MIEGSKSVIAIICTMVASQFMQSSLFIQRATAATKDAKSTYVLTQTNAVLGHVLTYVNADALRVDCMDNNAYLVAKAPDWRVVMFNPTMNAAVEMPYEKFLAHELSFSYVPSAGGGMNERWPKLRAGSMKVSGVEVSKFIIPANPRSRSLKESPNTLGYYLILEKKGFAIQPTKILAKLFYQPPLPGIPLGDRMNKQKFGQSNSFLDFRGNYAILSTSEIKEKSIPSDFFKYPHGFKKVTREIEVISDNARRKQLEDLSKDMGVGD
jgi:hypothetical protein